MKKFEVRFRPQALSDLFGLYRYIAAEAGHRIAGGYIDRIEGNLQKPRNISGEGHVTPRRPPRASHDGLRAPSNRRLYCGRRPREGDQGLLWR